MNAQLGRRLWADLHAYAWHYPRDPSAEARRRAGVWLAQFRLRIGGSRCSCRKEWDRILQICPPPLDSPEDLYWWTVAAHDRINHHLHKPLHAPDWSSTHPLILTP